MLPFFSGVIITFVLFLIVWAIHRFRLKRFLSSVTETVTAVNSGEYQARVLAPPPRGLSNWVETLNRLLDTVERDISELSRERNIFHYVLENMTTGAVLIAPTGRVQLMNRSAQDLFRKPIEQCLGQKHSKVFRDYSLNAAIDQALLFGTTWKDTLKVREDLTVEIQLQALPMNDMERYVQRVTYSVLLLCNDVSQWLRLERMRTDFVANVSHELQTPITAIRGFAETMLDELDEDADHRPFVKIMHDESVRMAHLVSDLLTLSKLEATSHALPLQATKLRPVLGQAIDRVRGEARKRNIEMETAFEEDVTVWADEDRLLQVALNLLSNAIHYTPPGGRITIWFEYFVDRVKVHIKDNGIGIAEQHQSRIFERFYRVNQDRSRATGGTGLGLAIVKHIVTGHGGEVGVTSQPGRGSDFWFTLSTVNPVLSNKS